MELTPQQLCEVEFSEQWRGYNRDQVDDFIERVAAAVSTMQDRIRKMTERAVRAEQQMREGTEADGAARRTLVLAQRTADATVAEARETAARLVAHAQEEARAIALAAEATVEAIPDAEPTARAEIVDLEVTRTRLQADVAALEAHVSDRRSRIKDLLDELQRRVDEGLEGRIALWPSPDDVRILSDFGDEDREDESSDYDDVTGVVVLDDVPLAEPHPDPEPEHHDTAAPSPSPAAEDLHPAPPEWEPAPSEHDAEPAPPSFPEPSLNFEGEAGKPEDESPTPVPAPAFDENPSDDVDDEEFFAQLRGALDDDAPLGPREDDPGTLRWRDDAKTAVAEVPRLYDQGQSEGKKFGLRKRRQRRRG
jgi:cell division initiation protein